MTIFRRRRVVSVPPSNPDAKLRDRARAWLAALRTASGLTTIDVTHDQIEALSLSDRIVVMSARRIARPGGLRDIHERPADPCVADFISTTNFLPAKVAAVSGALATLELAEAQRMEVAADRPQVVGSRVTLAFRPEQMRVAAADEASGAEGSVIATRVVSRSYIGGRWQVALDLGGAPIRLETEAPPTGEAVRLWLSREDCILFPGASDVAA